ncbi:MAG: dephospho-CoA kinase [Devosia sp.]
MRRLGLTGSIATGKSTALAEFEAQGIPVFSADAAVHALYAGAARGPIEALFPGVVRDGEVDRAALARKVLGQPQNLAALERLVHPMVRREIGDFLNRAEASGAELAVVDIPLLFESGHGWGFDAIIVTTCAAKIQRQRALARPGMTPDKLDAILARQMPQAEKLARADHVVDTSGSFDDTRAAVNAIIAQERAKAQAQP